MSKRQEGPIAYFEEDKESVSDFEPGEETKHKYRGEHEHYYCETVGQLLHLNKSISVYKGLIKFIR